MDFLTHLNGYLLVSNTLVFVERKESAGMGQTLAIIGIILGIAALAIHFVVKGLTLFPHAALIVGIIGAALVVVGAVMLRPRTAK